MSRTATTVPPRRLRATVQHPVPANREVAAVNAAAAAATVAELIRTRRPLVHCLTNDVTVGRVADALTAMGALPVMASAPEEAADMAAHAQALVLNLGTPSAARWRSARGAGQRATAQGIPIVLDPVGCGATPWRTQQARDLVAAVPPALIRGNAPEVAALAGMPPPQAQTLRGVTAVDNGPSDSEHDGAVTLATATARALRTVVLVTGRHDVLADADRVAVQHTGVPALARVVGGGDVLTAICAACMAVERDVFAAAQTGLALFASAARRAAESAHGPGTLWPALLDALAEITPADIARVDVTMPAPRTSSGGSDGME